MTWLKQSTAVDIMLGPFVDSTDGFTPETALSITQPDILLSKNGAAFAQKNAAQTLAHGSNGWYPANLNATDTGTLGSLVVQVYESGALPVWREFMVLPAVVYDSMVAGTDNLQVDTVQVSGTTQTARDLGANLDVAVSTRAAATAMTTAQADLDDIQTRLPAALVAGRMDSSVGAMAANVLTAAATAADFSTEVNAAVLAVLGALADAAADGDPTSADTLMMYMKQLVNTLVGTAGVVTFPAAATPANAVSLAEVIRQIYDEVAGLNGGALPAAAPTAAAVADQVWDEVLAGHLTAGSTGAALNGAGAAGDPWGTALPGAYGAGSAGAILGNLDDAVAAVQADTDNLQTRLPAALVGGRIDASVGAMAANVMTGAAADPTLGAELADATWDEALAGHAVAGSAGAALTTAAAGGGGGGATAADIADAVWDEALTGAAHNTVNSAGRRLRQLSSGLVHSGTAAGGTINTITLDAAASAVDGTYDPATIRIVGGTGTGQSRLIIQYTGATRVAAVGRDWSPAPDSTSEFEIISATNPQSTEEGLAQGGSLSTITLHATASALDNMYVGQTCVLRTGPGQDQSRIIIAYSGTTKVATMAFPFDIAPTAATGYMILPTGRTSVAQMLPGVLTASALAADATAELADAVWDETLSGHLTSGSTGAALDMAALGGGGGGGEVDLSPAALDAVKAEVVEALATDVYPEPGQGAPPATASLAAKLGYLYKFARNRITSSETQIRVYGDDNVTVDQKATQSEAAGLYERSEFGTGP